MRRPIESASGYGETSAQLGALCLFLSGIEYLIPKPVPFMRLGLANLPLMLGIDLLPFPAYCALIALKIVGQNLISGTLFSYVFLFSAAGSAASAFFMFLLRRGLGPRLIGFVGVGTAGALLSSTAQLALSWFFVFGEATKLIVPPFLAAGTLSGAALGFFAAAFSAKSRWYAERRL